MELRMELAERKDIPDIGRIMNVAARSVADPDYFVADDEEFVARHIDQEGFVLLAKADGKTAAFLIVRIPGAAEDNLGRDLHLPPEEWNRVAHMESVAVLPDFRGHGIQKKLMAEAERRLIQQGIRVSLATVHPDNSASLNSFLHMGYQVELTKLKYQSQIRHILKKELQADLLAAGEILS